MIKRLNKKISLILFIVLFLLSIISLLISLLSKNYVLLNENNTIEFEATFLSYEMDENLCEIETIEYSDKLKIRDINEVKNKDIIKSIQPNTKITFRIEDKFKEDFEKLDFIYICSLTYNNEEILTLESVNDSHIKAVQRIKITGYIFSGLLILGAIINLIIILT